MARLGITLIELLVVLSVIAMTAGVILPSAALYARRTKIEQLAHNISILCRETFERAVYSGRIHRISLSEDKLRLEAWFDENGRLNPALNHLLRPVTIPESFAIEWPENGWNTLPEGLCESPEVVLRDLDSSETLFFKIRAFDGALINAI